MFAWCICIKFALGMLFCARFIFSAVFNFMTHGSLGTTATVSDFARANHGEHHTTRRQRRPRSSHDRFLYSNDVMHFVKLFLSNTILVRACLVAQLFHVQPQSFDWPWRRCQNGPASKVWCHTISSTHYNVTIYRFVAVFARVFGRQRLPWMHYFDGRASIQ